MANEIPQEIDVEKLMDEDVDEMILEADVDGDSAVQNESESDAAGYSMVFPEDVPTVTVEVEEPKIKTVVKCMEDNDVYSHGRAVRVPETCDVRITVVTILKEISGVCCLRDSS